MEGSEGVGVNKQMIHVYWGDCHADGREFNGVWGDWARHKLGKAEKGQIKRNSQKIIKGRD